MKKEKIIKIKCDVKDFLNVGEVTPLQGNLKDKTKKDLEKLKGIIIRDGFVFPLFVARISKKNYTLDGHGRDEISIILKAEGYSFQKKSGEIGDFLPVVFIDAKNKKDAKEKLLYLNSRYGRITEKGLVEFISEAGFELDFENLRLDLDLPELDINSFGKNNYPQYYPELDEVEEIRGKAISKSGDLFLLDKRHRILCGDSTSKEDFDKLLAGKIPEMAFTDPPFNVNYQDIKKKHRKIKNDKMTEEEFEKFLSIVYSFLPVNSYVCCNWQSYKYFFDVSKAIKKPIKSCIVWDKMIPAQNLDKYYKRHEFILFHGKLGGEKTLRGDVIQYRREYSDLHPTYKPVGLIMLYIKDGSNPGNLVLDLFLGSGSTLIASEKSDRVCYGMEIDPLYIDTILRRYRKSFPDKEIECLNRKFNFNKLFNEDDK